MTPVSIVVPAFNAERTIEDAVRSLLALRYAGEVEIIVVDNGSVDATASILMRYQNRIRVVGEKRRGRSAARNAGLRAANHPAVAFIDADCQAAPEWLSNLIPRLAEPGVGIAGGRILASRPCNAVEEFGEWLHDHARAIEVCRPPYATTANWASPRTVLLDMGGFDETLRRCEDCDLSYRILQAGYRIVYEDRAVVSHRNHPTRYALFREGFDNGFHSVPAIAKHAAFLSQYGHSGVQFHRYRKLAANLGRMLSARGNERLGFETVFEAGKCTGKICGSLRFGRLEL